MTESEVRLALGTVQFGTAYGVAGRGIAVPPREVREVLDAAWSLGVRVLDTAPAYGDIEERLGELAGKRPFDIVSKISTLAESDCRTTEEFVSKSICRSRSRLGDRLTTLLFHCSADLLGDAGKAAWNAAREQAKRSRFKLGVSCYSPSEAARVCEEYSLAAVQLPGNALDQRLASGSSFQRLAGVEIHLRSVFLQGLLLLPVEIAINRVPGSGSALRGWAKWCSEREISPLRAALGAVKSIPGAQYCVVGVDSCSQLEETVAAWNDVQPLDVSSLSCEDVNIIDPRRWS